MMKGRDAPCKGNEGDCSHCLIVLKPEHSGRDGRRFTGLHIEGVVFHVHVSALYTQENSSSGLTVMKVLSKGCPQENR